MAHILGVLAVATFLLSFQLKTRRNIIAVNLTSRLLYILQYLCLGALEGAVLDSMGLLSSLVAQQKGRPFCGKTLCFDCHCDQCGFAGCRDFFV